MIDRIYGYKLMDGNIHIQASYQYRCNIYNKCGAILNANSHGRSCNFLDGRNVGSNVDVSPI